MDSIRSGRTILKKITTTFFGDPDKGFAEADLITEHRYIARKSRMQPWSRTARWRLLRRIRKPAKQTASPCGPRPRFRITCQHKLSIVLELPMSQIRVIKPLVEAALAARVK